MKYPLSSEETRKDSTTTISLRKVNGLSQDEYLLPLLLFQKPRRISDAAVGCENM